MRRPGTKMLWGSKADLRRGPAETSGAHAARIRRRSEDPVSKVLSRGLTDPSGAHRDGLRAGGANRRAVSPPTAEVD